VIEEAIEKVIETVIEEAIETVIVNPAPKVAGELSCRPSSTSGSELPDTREGGCVAIATALVRLENRCLLSTCPRPLITS